MTQTITPETVSRSTPNCYPRCPNNIIMDNLKKLNPCMDIVVMSTATLFRHPGTSTIDTSVKDGIYNLLASKDPHAEGSFRPKYPINPEIEVHVFDTLYGLLSLMSASATGLYQNIPIKSSPQIHVNNGAGWKPTQSLTKWVLSILNDGILGAATQGLGISPILESLGTSIDTWAGFGGWAPQVSPYFSFKENPFSNKASFSADIVLINDGTDTAEKNANFLNTVVRDSLIGQDKNASNVFGVWNPPKLFNIFLKFGAGTKPVKKFHLCTLDANVSPEGIIRHGIPDAYSVKLTFNSLLPDTIDNWPGSNGFPTTTDTSDDAIDYNLLSNSGSSPETGESVLEFATGRSMDMSNLTSTWTQYAEEEARDKEAIAQQRVRERQRQNGS